MRIVTMLLLAWALPVLSWGESTSLCVPGEKVYFSCAAVRGKLIAICGSTDLSSADSYLQYRYGLPDHVELEYPAVREGSLKQFRFYHYVRPRVTRIGLSFQSGDYSYTVYDHYEGDIEPEETASGVSVLKKDATTETDIACNGEVTNELIDLEDFVPCDPDNAMSNCSE